MLVRLAQELASRNASRIAHADLVGIVNYAAPSWRPRFHLVDLVDGSARAVLTAHGRGSDPRHTGWLQKFSNEIGSNASSRGAYLTGAEYHGKYGRSLRLVGLDAANSNAEARAIVIHPAWYVGKDMLDRYGKLGRSEGCFALSAGDLPSVLDRLGEGRLIFAGRFDALAA